MKWFPSLAIFIAAVAVALSPLRADTVYVMDTANSAVLQVTPDGTISTFLQDAVHFRSLTDFAFGPDGSLFTLAIGDGFQPNSKSVVYRHTPGGLWTNFHQEDLNARPMQSVVSDAFGNVVVRLRETTPSTTDIFLRVDSITGDTSPFSGTAVHSSGESTMAFDGAGVFYYQSGVFIERNGINYISGQTSHFAADLAGNFYVELVIDGIRGIYRVDNGVTTPIAPGVFGFMAVDSSGDIYVNQAGTLLQVTPGGTVTPIATGLPNQAIATIVPEPTSDLLLGLAAAGMLTTTRRRHPRQPVPS